MSKTLSEADRRNNLNQSEANRVSELADADMTRSDMTDALNEIDTLDLDTGEITVGQDTDAPIEFSVGSFAGDDVATMKPGGTGFGIIGTSVTPWSIINGNTFRVHNEIIPDSSNIDIGSSLDPFDEGHYNDLFFEDGEIGEPGDNQIEVGNLGNGETALFPDVDGTCQLGGVNSKEFSSVWAKDFYSEGSVVATDGADPLAGLAEAIAPPEHCQKCDDDGNMEALSIGNLAEELWNIATAQQRKIDGLEERLSKLEAQNE